MSRYQCPSCRDNSGNLYVRTMVYAQLVQPEGEPFLEMDELHDSPGDFDYQSPVKCRCCGWEGKLCQAEFPEDDS